MRTHAAAAASSSHRLACSSGSAGRRLTALRAAAANCVLGGGGWRRAPRSSPVHRAPPPRVASSALAGQALAAAQPRAPPRAARAMAGGRGRGPPSRGGRGAEAAEIAALEAAIAAGAPAAGTNPLSLVTKGAEVRAAAASAGTTAPMAAARTFEQLPLSRATLDGLKAAKYKAMTAIQRAALPHALAGRDVLGAAKTGSGKTLAFLIPLVEKLYRLRWSPSDGVGALVISPTRELAMQIFDTLRKFATHHAFSAGLLIGGKDVEFEKQKVGGMNILVCTPGRLLQHMDETPYFDCSGLSMLVLDEADRVLDMGFSATLNAILDFLPRGRQTLLFSATQTRKVSDLARLSLRDAEYLSVHEHAASATPPRLTQLAATVALPDKMHALWGFIKTHLTSKTLIFLSSCRQVAFLHEALRQLRPGVPLRALHGRMKQPRRLAAFYDFCAAPAMVLLATDVAARGLDFPAVDWVLQADAPEDVASYIHRVGRTARYTAAGKALLLLAPSEAALLPQLAAAKIAVATTTINLSKTPLITPALAGLLSQEPLLKTQAQKAVVSYLKSVFLQPNKAVFDVAKLPVEAYAASLGLTSAPKLRFVARARGGRMTEMEAAAAAAAAGGGGGGGEDDGSDSDEDADEGESDGEEAAAAGGAGGAASDGAGDSEDELLRVKRANHLLPGEAAAARAPAPGEVAPPARAKPKKLRIRAGGVAGGARGTKVVFDADGTPRMPLEAMALAQRAKDSALAAAEDGTPSGEAAAYRAAVAARYAESAAARAAADVADKVRERELRREKKRARKMKLRARAERGGGGVASAVLGAYDDADDDDDDGGGGGGGGASDGGDGDSSSEEAPQERVKRRKREAAHAGMAKATASAPDDIAALEAAALARLARGGAAGRRG